MNLVLLAAWRGRQEPRHALRPAAPRGLISRSTPSTPSTPSAPPALPAPHRWAEGQALLAGAPPLPPLSDDTTADPGASPAHAPQAPDQDEALEACGWHDSSWALLQGLIVVEGPPSGPASLPEMIENAAYPPVFCRFLQASA